MTFIPTSRWMHTGGRVARFGYRLYAADLTERSAVNALLQGADAVVHCAFGGDSDQDLATQNLLKAAAEAEVTMFIHISTTEAYAVQEGTVDEDSSIRSKGVDYGAVKGRIDTLVQSYAARFESLVVLRPAIIYGPLSDAWTIRPIRRLLDGWRPRTEELRGIGNFVHIADLCYIIEQILYRSVRGAHVYNVVGPEVISWTEYFQSFAQTLGISIPAGDVATTEKEQLGFVRAMLRMLPTPMRRKLVGSMSSCSLGMQTISHWKRLQALEPDLAEKVLYARNVRYSTARLRRDGFVPRIGLEEGIHQSVAWARQVGLAD